MGYRVYDLARQGTTVDLFGPDAFSIENGEKDGVYHLRHFEMRLPRRNQLFQLIACK